MKIILCPVGDINDQILTMLQGKLSLVFGCKVELGRKILIPVAALDKKRRQYHATKIMAVLDRLPRTGNVKLLGVVDVDLFNESRNFIFGIADVRSGICLISLTRLRQEFYGDEVDESIFNERAIKEAIHEAGHVLGLKDCPGIKCVMHFSDTIRDIDNKGTAFCFRCRPKLL